MNDLFFHKMHGAGNHFVVLDQLERPIPVGAELPRLAELLCSGHWGAGADGLLTLESPRAAAAVAGAKVRMRMWNPDGTEDMCGNGLRCVVALAWAKGHVGQRNFVVETHSGLRNATVLKEGLIRVGMGEPQYAAPDVPHAIPDVGIRALDYVLPVGEVSLADVSTLSTGSTHTVIFTGQTVGEDVFAHLSPLIEHHVWFPERTSVLWATRAGEDRFRVRIWERGVGETMACGTGACAVAVAAGATGRAGSRVAIESRGGTLEIEHHPGREIVLTGPAVQIYNGRTTLEALLASVPPERELVELTLPS